MLIVEIWSLYARLERLVRSGSANRLLLLYVLLSPSPLIRLRFSACHPRHNTDDAVLYAALWYDRSSLRFTLRLLVYDNDWTLRRSRERRQSAPSSPTQSLITPFVRSSATAVESGTSARSETLATTESALLLRPSLPTPALPLPKRPLPNLSSRLNPHRLQREEEVERQ